MKRGFTLVELLAVIVLLAIILAIAIPGVSSLIDNARLQAYKNQESLLKTAARYYLNGNNSLYPATNGEVIYIPLSDLISNNFISNIVDSKDKSTCDTTYSGVKVEMINNNYVYSPYLKCSNYKTDNTIPLFATDISGTNLTVTGTDDNVLSFNGSSNYALINTTFPATLTIETWGYASDIFAKMIWSFDGNLYSAGPDLYPTGNVLSLNTGDGASNLFSNSTYPSLNKWHHYAVVFDQTSNLGTLYVDGSLVGTATYRNPAGAHLYIGRYDYGGYHWNGFIKDIKIWTTIRTAAEINNDMNNNLIGNEAGLFAYYKMDEMEGTTLNDSGPSKYNGTIYGATWIKNSGVSEIRIKQGSTTISTSNDNPHIFSLSSGTYTVEVQDYTGNIASKSVVIP